MLEQFAEHGQSPKALVECPGCGKELLRERARIRSCGHTLCLSCAQRGLRPAQTRFIESISGLLHIIKQVAETGPHGSHKALVECPDCNTIYLKTRGGIQHDGHTLCLNCVRRCRAPIIENSEYIIVLEQFAEPGHNPKALVQCPFCDKVFLKQRSAIRSSEHTACRLCTRRYLASNAVFIENIPSQLIIVEQYADGRSGCGRALCTIQCPDCGDIRTAERQSIMATQSSLCQSCNQTGERNWRWKGGYSPSYGPRWNLLSQSTMERDNQTCQLCGRAIDQGRLHVHHIIPYSDDPNNSPENLITLCPSCHCWADHHLDESIPMLGAIVDAIYNGW